ncbi:unnamed protein product [Urochloa decumbens]|uniref:DUF4283 domain-containing protein n=1 Tax=Urochloa decumbens TaxID=240449 RepID=A0ABC9G4R8_9POAL
MAMDCALSQCRKLKMYGFGVHGQGFYSIEIPDKSNAEKFGALVVIQDGIANEERVAKELQHLIKAEWDFEVKQIAKGEYRASFPDQASIDTYSKLTGLKLPLFGITVQIINSNVDPAATAVLQTAWVKVYGIPGYAKEEDIVKEITSLVGEPIKVDEFSLVRDEPVRVRINCRDPAKVKGAVEIFFNGVGHEIRFIAEGFHLRAQSKGDGPPGPGGSNDKGGKGLDREKKGDASRKAGGPANKTGNNNTKEQDTSQGDSQDDSMDDLVNDGSPKEQTTYQEVADWPTPLAAIHPVHGLMKNFEEANREVLGLDEDVDATFAKPASIENLEDSYGEVVEVNETVNIFPAKATITNEEESMKEVATQDSEILSEIAEQKGQNTIPAGKLLVHGREGPFIMDADKWPKLKLPDEEPQLTQEEDLMDNFLEQPIQNDEEDPKGWVVQRSKKKQKKLTVTKKRKPVVATRTSARVPRDGIPIATKAMNRAQGKNELAQGVLWALWLGRNKMAIEKTFPSTPLVALRSGLIFVQKWKSLLKPEDAGKITKVLEKAQGWMGNFSLSTAAFTDIGEI